MYLSGSTDTMPPQNKEVSSLFCDATVPEWHSQSPDLNIIEL